VIVIGAGPAGSTTARYAARRGLSVLMIERRSTVGVPVQCGEYVAHNSEVETIYPGVSGLEDLMKAAYAAKYIDTRLIRIISPRGRKFELRFDGFTISRSSMDQMIAAQAVEEGAELMTGVNALDVKGNKVFTTRGVHEGKVIVGADGPFSRVARSVGLEWPVSAPAMSATVKGSFADVTEMYFGDIAPGGYAWIIPKGATANVGVGVWPRFKGNLDVPFRAFLKKLNLTGVRGTGGYVPIMGPVPATVRGNALLVGDAAGHVMPTNGGGINTGMICGRIAGNCIADHLGKGAALTEYETKWRSVVSKALRNGRRTRIMGNLFFGGEGRLEQAMRFLGPKRMARAIRCQRLFLAR